MNFIYNGSGIVAAVDGSEYIYSADELEFEVRLGSIATFERLLSTTMLVLLLSRKLKWNLGQAVNLSNTSILQLNFDHDYLLVNVNLTTTDRIVLIDRTTGNSSLIGDPKYSQTEPEIGYGFVVWLSKDNLDPNNPSVEYLDGEIFMDLQTGPKRLQLIPYTKLIQVFLSHIVYLGTNSQGESVVRVQLREVILQPYSNMVLQIGLFILLGLTFTYVWQRQVENRVALIELIVIPYSCSDFLDVQ